MARLSATFSKISAGMRLRTTRCFLIPHAHFRCYNKTIGVMHKTIELFVFWAYPICFRLLTPPKSLVSIARRHTTPPSHPHPSRTSEAGKTFARYRHGFTGEFAGSNAGSYVSLLDLERA